MTANNETIRIPEKIMLNIRKYPLMIREPVEWRRKIRPVSRAAKETIAKNKRSVRNRFEKRGGIGSLCGAAGSHRKNQYVSSPIPTKVPRFCKIA